MGELFQGLLAFELGAIREFPGGITLDVFGETELGLVGTFYIFNFGKRVSKELFLSLAVWAPGGAIHS